MPELGREVLVDEEDLHGYSGFGHGDEAEQVVLEHPREGRAGATSINAGRAEQGVERRNRTPWARLGKRRQEQRGVRHAAFGGMVRQRKGQELR